MAKTPEKITFKTFLNPITLTTTLILLAGLILAGLAALFLGHQPAASGAVVPDVTRIAAPTQTPQNVEPTPFPTPTATSLFFLPDGVIGVGAYVQVAGTEGAGLRMRSDPGLDGEVHFTALDSEVFLVIEGPVEADGYTWWRLEAPYDQNRRGWSAGDFLTPIEEEGD